MKAAPESEPVHGSSQGPDNILVLYLSEGLAQHKETEQVRMTNKLFENGR
jgi:hypothetical protein